LWCSPGTPVSSTNKTDFHDITEILLKVALNTITLTLKSKSRPKKYVSCYIKFRVIVFNATFNNISVISWKSVLLVEETGVPGEHHKHVVSH
jgi:hypothetical protein